MVFVDCFFRFLHSCRHAVLIFWTICLILGGVFGPSFPNKCTFKLVAPAGSPGAAAEQLLYDNYPFMTDQGLGVVYAEVNYSMADVTKDAGTHTFLIELNTSLTTKPEFANLNPHMFSFLDVDAHGFHSFVSHLVSKDNRSTLAFITYSNNHTSSVDNMMNFIESFVSEQETRFNYHSFGFVSQDSLMMDTRHGISADIDTMDLIVIPAALIVLFAYLRSFSLLLIAFFTLPCALLFSFALMGWAIDLFDIDVIIFAPSVMSAVVVALSVDYSLFLLSRFQKERRFKLHDHAVREMVAHSGEIVFKSGSTLTLSFLGLTLLKSSWMATLGLSAAVALICAIIINCTFTPAILLTFPSIFGLGPCDCCNRVVDRDAAPSEAVKKQRKSVYNFIARVVTTRFGAILIIVILYSLCSPLIYQNRHLTYTVDNHKFFPADSPSLHTIEAISSSGFQRGMIAPYYVLCQSNITGPRPENSVAYGNYNGSVFSANFFNVLNDLSGRLSSNVRHVNSSDIISISYMNGAELPFTLANIFMIPDVHTPDAIAYRLLYHKITNNDSSVTAVVVTPDAAPFGQESIDTLLDIRALLSEFNANQSFIAHCDVAGGLMDQNDLVDVIFASFPFQILITSAVVFGWMLIMFRNLLLAVRLVLTMVLSIGSSFGLAIGVFQFGWFPVVHPSGAAMLWATPVICFSILLGLMLDYDIFLSARVRELRLKGHDTRSAIRRAVYSQCPVINTAGLIMAISFFGLFITSGEDVTREVGFLLLVFVLFDTLVVRPTVAPAWMFLFGDSQWWPMKVPPANPAKDEYYCFDDLFGDNSQTSINAETSPLLS